MKNLQVSGRRLGGFALVPALFLIVVVGLLAVIAVRITTAQQQTVVLGLQQARALAAARAGIDWAAYNALNGNCAGGTLNLAAASLAGYTVVVTCAATAYSDGNFRQLRQRGFRPARRACDIHQRDLIRA